MIRAAANE